jgi:hypothetical protein
VRHKAVPKNQIFFKEIDYTFVFGFDLADDLYEKLILLIKTMYYNGYNLDIIYKKICFIFGDFEKTLYSENELILLNERYEKIKLEVLSTKKSEIVNLPDYTQFSFVIKFLKDK